MIVFSEGEVEWLIRTLLDSFGGMVKIHGL